MTDSDNPRRVLLKLSGEAFGGGKVGIDTQVIRRIAEEIVPAVQQGVQVAIVVGGGNFFRGAELQQAGIDRSRGDYMGMLGTVMNCLALQDFLEQEGQATRVQTAITMGQVAEPYIPLKAIRHLEKGRVVIFGAGAGMPYFSTDTVSIQRSLEIHCDEVLMGKNGVDGVYTPSSAMKSARGSPPPNRAWPSKPQTPTIESSVHRRTTLTNTNTQGVNMSLIDQAKEQMAKTVENTKENFSGIRTGRANPALLNGITVDYYGAPTPIKAVASIGVPEPRTLSVTPFDASQAGAVEKALRNSDLGISPNRDGNVIRLTMPELTEDRRKEYVKLAKGKAEDGKVAVRNIRRKTKETIDKAVKDGEMGEDEGDRLLKDLDKVTKSVTDEIDTLLETKQKEIMEV